MSTETLNTLVGFGGVFLLGVIGFIIAWFSPPEERNGKNGGEARRSP
jgi:phage shock protein PspC (stress-responsive transcriptional regulator)